MFFYISFLFFCSYTLLAQASVLETITHTFTFYNNNQLDKKQYTLYKDYFSDKNDTMLNLRFIPEQCTNTFSLETEQVICNNQGIHFKNLKEKHVDLILKPLTIKPKNKDADFQLFKLLEKNTAKELKIIEDWYILFLIKEDLQEKIHRHIDYNNKESLSHRETFTNINNSKYLCNDIDYSPAYYQALQSINCQQSELDLCAIENNCFKSFCEDLDGYYPNFRERVSRLIVTSFHLQTTTLTVLRLPQLKDIVVKGDISIDVNFNHSMLYNKLFYDNEDNFNPITIYIEKAHKRNSQIKKNILFCYKITEFLPLISLNMLLSIILIIYELGTDYYSTLAAVTLRMIAVFAFLTPDPGQHYSSKDLDNYYNKDGFYNTAHTFLHRSDTFWILPIIFDLYCLIKGNTNFRKAFLLNRLSLIGFNMFLFLSCRFKDLRILYSIATKDVFVELKSNST